MTESEPEKCVECKDKMHSELSAFFLSLAPSLDANRSILKNFWKIYMDLVWYPDGQPKQVIPEERNFIRSLGHSGYSLSDVAWIVNRSKSTIHSILHEEASGTEKTKT